MSHVKVIALDSPADTYEVNVNDRDGTNTSHRVHLADGIYEKLPHGGKSPEDCLKAAFLFLLERETKEMILRQFEFDVIRRYFPEFDQKFVGYLEKV